MVILAAQPEPTSGAPLVLRLLTKTHLRLVAIGFLLMTIYAWLLPIGFFPGDAFRFDAMDLPARANAALQAVMLPVVAIGLWTAEVWGRVVWFMAVSVHMALLLTAAVVLPMPEVLLIFHLVSLVIYAGLAIATTIIDKKA